MITAKEAYEKSQYGARLRRLRRITKNIENEINKACDGGFSYCRVYFAEISEDMQQEILKTLTDVGYDAKYETRGKGENCSFFIVWSHMRETYSMTYSVNIDDLPDMIPFKEFKETFTRV